MNWNICWPESNQISVSTMAELDELLDRLTAEASLAGDPILVQVDASDGASMSIGVGGLDSIIDYVSASKMPPYYISLGDPERDGEIRFSYMNQSSEFPASFCIAPELARLVLREFVNTGKRSDVIDWEEG